MRRTSNLRKVLIGAIVAANVAVGFGVAGRAGAQGDDDDPACLVEECKCSAKGPSGDCTRLWTIPDMPACETNQFCRQQA